jgi:hypothetical protein
MLVKADGFNRLSRKICRLKSGGDSRNADLAIQARQEVMRMSAGLLLIEIYGKLIRHGYARQTRLG